MELVPRVLKEQESRSRGDPSNALISSIASEWRGSHNGSKITQTGGEAVLVWPFIICRRKSKQESYSPVPGRLDRLTGKRQWLLKK